MLYAFNAQIQNIPNVKQPVFLSANQIVDITRAQKIAEIRLRFTNWIL